MKRLMTGMAMVLGALVYAAHGAGPAAAETFITVASTTSTQNSGLYDYILPRFTTKTGITVRVIAVGTTALRLIETAAAGDGRIAPFEGMTDIFIYPGYHFQVTDGLMTNFHLPKSTLLMLVSALMGPEKIKQIYTHAVSQRYRFFSYGDASLLIP